MIRRRPGMAARDRMEMQMKTRRKVRAARAFTLLEVLMVLVILGMLAGIVVYQLGGVREKAERDATAVNIAAVEGAIDLYHGAVGKYPTSLQELVTAPDDEIDRQKWAGPYIKDAEKFKDAWGRPLDYKCPGDVNSNTYDLSSPGKDGQSGNDDDVTNWKKT
jgi:general secretion pathway protein G